MKRDLCSDAVVPLRIELLEMNGINAYDDIGDPLESWHDDYPAARLELAKRVLESRAKEFADDPATCQAVLDKIDELFQAEG